MGAIFQWEKGMFEPRGEKKKILVALRRLRRREARKLLEERSAKMAPERSPGLREKPGGRPRGREPPSPSRLISDHPTPAVSKGEGRDRFIDFRVLEVLANPVKDAK